MSEDRIPVRNPNTGDADAMTFDGQPIYIARSAVERVVLTVLAEVADETANAFRSTSVIADASVTSTPDNVSDPTPRICLRTGSAGVPTLHFVAIRLAQSTILIA